METLLNSVKGIMSQEGPPLTGGLPDQLAHTVCRMGAQGGSTEKSSPVLKQVRGSAVGPGGSPRNSMGHWESTPGTETEGHFEPEETYNTTGNGAPSRPVAGRHPEQGCSGNRATSRRTKDTASQMSYTTSGNRGDIGLNP